MFNRNGEGERRGRGSDRGARLHLDPLANFISNGTEKRERE